MCASLRHLRECKSTGWDVFYLHLGKSHLTKIFSNGLAVSHQQGVLVKEIAWRLKTFSLHDTFFFLVGAAIASEDSHGRNSAIKGGSTEVFHENHPPHQQGKKHWSHWKQTKPHSQQNKSVHQKGGSIEYFGVYKKNQVVVSKIFFIFTPI